jgi:hypothetical protein
MSHTPPLGVLKNLSFHTLIAKEVKDMRYGQLTFNVVLKDAVAILKTMKVTRSRRIKYPIDKGLDKTKKTV